MGFYMNLIKQQEWLVGQIVILIKLSHWDGSPCCSSPQIFNIFLIQNSAPPFEITKSAYVMFQVISLLKTRLFIIGKI